MSRIAHRPGRVQTTRRAHGARAAGQQAFPGLGMLVFEGAQLVAALPVVEGELLVGRAPECSLRVHDPEVSRRHCSIACSGGAVALQDLGSANGTFLHGQRVGAAQVEHGDVATLGQVLLKFVRMGSPEWEVHCALFEQIYSDELTGLLNRRGLRLRTDALLATLPAGTPLALLMLDLDRFKQVNDRFGHVAGDQAIRDAGAQLRAALPSDTVAARLGGEEFAVLLSGSDAASAGSVAEQLRAAVAARPLRLGGHVVPITVSVGVALGIAPLPSLRPLFLRADEALYQAKAAGRNCCVTARELAGGERANVA